MVKLVWLEDGLWLVERWWEVIIDNAIGKWHEIKCGHYEIKPDMKMCYWGKCQFEMKEDLKAATLTSIIKLKTNKTVVVKVI